MYIRDVPEQNFHGPDGTRVRPQSQGPEHGTDFGTVIRETTLLLLPWHKFEYLKQTVVESPIIASALKANTQPNTSLKFMN